MCGGWGERAGAGDSKGWYSKGLPQTVNTTHTPPPPLTPTMTTTPLTPIHPLTQAPPLTCGQLSPLHELPALHTRLKNNLNAGHVAAIIHLVGCWQAGVDEGVGVVGGGGGGQKNPRDRLKRVMCTQGQCVMRPINRRLHVPSTSASFTQTCSLLLSQLAPCTPPLNWQEQQVVA